MRARHVSNVSSSTPAAIRFLLVLGWFIAGALDIVGLVELDSAAATPTIAGFDEPGGPPAVGEPPPEDCILPSLAQPLTTRPNKVIKIVFPSMDTSLIN
jgi:hypothetical protein